jgi:hypothetical protein
VLGVVNAGVSLDSVLRDDGREDERTELLRAFDRLPILADALLDAGGDDEALLAHLRAPGPHVRGCWALDVILGKQ